MKLTERSIIEQLTAEIWEAKKQGLSGRIHLTVDLNNGGIARAEVSRARMLRAEPDPGRTARSDEVATW